MSLDRKNRLPLFIGLVLALITLAVYWGLLNGDFVNYDDSSYIIENPHVHNGLTLRGLGWAFNIGYASNWHPLTWLAHMADCQLFDLEPRWHHLTNLLLHVANAVLLFGLLRRTTGALWRSAVAAALFAWHPAHVESVAWVSERKDVLSTFFFLLTIWAYSRYAAAHSPQSTVHGPPSRVEGRGSGGEAGVGGRGSRGQGREARGEGGPAFRPSPPGPRFSAPGATAHDAWRWYGLALILFACGLMSKPMVVTLPCMLLLLDYWPLRRVELSAAGPKLKAAWPLLREKLAFFGLALAASAVTVLAQSRGGAMKPVEAVPLGIRCANALVSYLRYAGELLWPHDLAVFYPYIWPWPLWVIGSAAVILLAVSWLALAWRRRAPWFPVGWFWFLVTLVPVIGLVQVGEQAMADRYTYIPSIGFFVVICWAAPQLLGERPLRRPALGFAAAVALCACALLTRAQAACWRNSLSLFQHAVAVTGDNPVSRTALGSALAATNRLEEAIAQYNIALRLEPRYGLVHTDLGVALARLGRHDEAVAQYQQALEFNPDDALAHYNLANALNPDYVEESASAAKVTARRTDAAQARQHYLRALALDPGHLNARINLGNLEASEGNYAAAIRCYEEAIGVDPRSALAHFSLAAALAGSPVQRDRRADAVKHFRQALRFKPDWVEALNDLAWMLATDENKEVRNGAQAVSLATRACELTNYKDAHVLSTLDAAYAESGRFADAIGAAEITRALAQAAGDREWAEAARARLELYRAGKAYHQGDSSGNR